MCRAADLTALLTTVLLALANSGCDSSFKYESGSTVYTDTSSSGWVTITSPNASGADTTYCNTGGLAGEAFISPSYSSCCSGDAIADTGVTVSWENRTTGASGAAYQFATYSALFGTPFISHHYWTASVPLIVGSNSVRISAVDPAGVNGNANFTFNKPALSYKAAGKVSSNDALGIGYRQGGGFQLHLAGVVEASTTTLSNSVTNNGDYNFTCLPNGSYTVTPTPNAFNYNFAPAYLNFVVADQDVSALDFTTAAYTVSGTVTWSSSGTPASYIEVRIYGGTTSWSYWTGSDGRYSFIVPDGSYTLRPEHSSTPIARSVSVTGAAVPGQDFLLY